MTAKIELPVSKSIGARFLVASYFAGTLPADPYFEDNDDLQVMQNVLLTLYADEEEVDYGETPLDVHASGTAMRFVTAVCASTPEADFVVTGTERLCQRPMQPLIETLREAGAVIECRGKDETGPYRVTGAKLKGGDFAIKGNVSSQFISALMLVAPSWEKGMTLNFLTPLVSAPYVKMTAEVMKKFSVNAELTETEVRVPSASYIDPENFKVERDWSSAAFFYEAAALGAQEMLLEGLEAPDKSIQGDSVTADLFAKLGVKTEINADGVIVTRPSSSEDNEDAKGKEKIVVNMSDCPDLVPAFAVACAFTGHPFRLAGVKNLRNKESDRIEALISQMAKFGCALEAGDDTFECDNPEVKFDEEVTVNTFDDHRIAMAFAMTALKCGKVRIENPETVEKSFAGFWEQLSKTGLRCRMDGNIMVVEK